METWCGAATSERPAMGGRIANKAFAAILHIAFFIRHTGLAAAFDTQQIATMLVLFAGQSRPHFAGPYRATMASIAISIAAFAVLGAVNIGCMLGPWLLGASVSDDFFKGR